jgi:hypothetical protein
MSRHSREHGRGILWEAGNSEFETLRGSKLRGAHTFLEMKTNEVRLYGYSEMETLQSLKLSMGAHSVALESL